MFTKSTLLVVISAVIVVTAAAARPAVAQGPAHPMMTPADLKWGPAPPVLPPGAQVAVLDGDPFKPGFFSMRLKMPDGYKVAPHWHPTDENVVVIQGTLGLGMGNTANDAAARMMPAASFVKMPKEMRHYALAKGETIIQIYGEGPFVVNYVNPKDDPSKKPGR